MRDVYDFMHLAEIMDIEIEPLRLVCLRHDLPVRRLVRRSLDEDGPVRRSSNEDGPVGRSSNEDGSLVPLFYYLLQNFTPIFQIY